jgi:hypothetical protein
MYRREDGSLTCQTCGPAPWRTWDHTPWNDLVAAVTASQPKLAPRAGAWRSGDPAMTDITSHLGTVGCRAPPHTPFLSIVPGK